MSINDTLNIFNIHICMYLALLKPNLTTLTTARPQSSQADELTTVEILYCGKN